MRASSARRCCKHEAAPELPCHVEKSLANSIGILNDKLLEQTVTLKTALETAPVEPPAKRRCAITTTLLPLIWTRCAIPSTVSRR